MVLWFHDVKMLVKVQAACFGGQHRGPGLAKLFNADVGNKQNATNKCCCFLISPNVDPNGGSRHNWSRGACWHQRGSASRAPEHVGRTGHAPEHGPHGPWIHRCAGTPVWGRRMCRINSFAPCGCVPEQPVYRSVYRYSFFWFSAFQRCQGVIGGTFWPLDAT